MYIIIMFFYLVNFIIHAHNNEVYKVNFYSSYIQLIVI